MEEEKKSFEIDMVRGPVLKKMLLFSLPLMCSSILQLLFNAADIIVVRRRQLSCGSRFQLGFDHPDDQSVHRIFRRRQCNGSSFLRSEKAKGFEGNGAYRHDAQRGGRPYPYSDRTNRSPADSHLDGSAGGSSGFGDAVSASIFFGDDGNDDL